LPVVFLTQCVTALYLQFSYIQFDQSEPSFSSDIEADSKKWRCCLRSYW